MYFHGSLIKNMNPFPLSNINVKEFSISEFGLSYSDQRERDGANLSVIQVFLDGPDREGKRRRTPPFMDNRSMISGLIRVRSQLTMRLASAWHLFYGRWEFFSVLQ
jgi:hypothetical protein